MSRVVLDPSGDYRIVPGDNLTEFAPETFDLIVSLFTFDNVPSTAKARIFSDLRNLLRPNRNYRERRLISGYLHA